MRKITVDPLARHAHAFQLTLGNAILQELQTKNIRIPQNKKEDPQFSNFIHALNTNDWLAAAYFLSTGESSTLQRLLKQENTLLAHLGKRHLTVLFQAAESFYQDRDAWRGQLQEAYLFGTLPAYGPTVVDGNPVNAPYIFKAGVAKHGRNLTSLIPVFHEYEKINQLYHKPATSTEGAPIRFTQGHNWSYCHARMDLADPKVFHPKKKRVLMNWDAHRDLSPPFRHLSQELAILSDLIPYNNERLLKLIRNADTKQELVEVSAMISIAGWILPLLHSRKFEHEDVSELIIVLPQEAQQTSQKNYWPPYGTHIMQIGHSVADSDEIEKIYNELDRLEPLVELPGPEGENGKRALQRVQNRLATLAQSDGFKAIQSTSEDSRLRTVRQSVSGLVQDTRKIKVHLVDPDNLSGIFKKIGNADIYLSVDVDFSGTAHLGGWYNEVNPIPHYPLNNNSDEEARHVELIQRFESFYQQAAKQIKGVSIANSPDYTADESRRRPASKIMEILTKNVSQDQPDWISGEAHRIVPPKLENHPLHNFLIPAAAALGISLTTALFWHYNRTQKLQALSETDV